MCSVPCEFTCLYTADWLNHLGVHSLNFLCNPILVAGLSTWPQTHSKERGASFLQDVWIFSEPDEDGAHAGVLNRREDEHDECCEGVVRDIRSRWRRPSRRLNLLEHQRGSLGLCIAPRRCRRVKYTAAVDDGLARSADSLERSTYVEVREQCRQHCTTSPHQHNAK